MLKGHHGVCGERGEGRETGRLGIEQTSVAMSRHVAGDTDGRNSAGSKSFDCLQSPPPPSLAHRRRTGLGAAARRTVRVSQSCWGFRGLLDAGRESVPHLRRRPVRSRAFSRRSPRPDLSAPSITVRRCCATQVEHEQLALRVGAGTQPTRVRSAQRVPRRYGAHRPVRNAVLPLSPVSLLAPYRPGDCDLATRGHRAQKPLQRGR